MFEGADSSPWRSDHRQQGAHYNTYGCKTDDGMAALREFLPNGADAMNFVLFSTSGVHGHYGTIEEAERILSTGLDECGDEASSPTVTFLIVQPRIVCLRYGNCEPKTPDDIAFLKALRASSMAAVQTIGVEER